jgi:hypothetical protein
MSQRSPQQLEPERLVIRPWPDEVVERYGFEPTSAYVELAWLPVLGPSATWLYRRLAAGLRAHPEGYTLDLAELARSLGLGEGTGPNSSIVRTVRRLVAFGVARVDDDGMVRVRRRIGPLTQRQVDRLVPRLQRAHAELVARQRVSAGAR